jgi:protein required for attachment to host cells
MTGLPLTWFVVADGGRAHILARRPDGGFAGVTDIDSPVQHEPSRELASDRPGRARESVGGARHAVAPRSDPHDKAKHDFAHLVAEQVNAAAARDDFAALVLVAPSPILADIKERLDSAAASRLAGEIAKDLTKLPAGELHQRLAEIGAAP